MFVQLYLSQWREFARDRMALFFTILFPLIFISIFGLLYGGGSKFDEKVGIVLEDQGPIGPQLASAIEGLTQTPAGQDADKNVFSDMKFSRGNASDLESQLQKGDLQALVIIPAGLSDSIISGKPMSVTVKVDQSSQVFAPFFQGVVGNIVQSVDQGITQSKPMLTMQVQSVLSSQIRGIDLLIPGILAMSIMQLGLFATAQPMIAMRTQGVLKRFNATPLPRWMLLVSYVAMRLTIGLLQTIIIIAVGKLMFDVAILGSIVALLGWLLLSILMFIAIGFFVAAIAKTEESGNAITQLINFPMLFLSGVFFPVTGLPDWLQVVVKAFPLTYTVDSLKQVMINAPPINTPLVNLVVQLGWLVVMTVLSIRFFKWEAR
ncbi:ABC transporter permease [Herpetosiphon llansteffanensis]|uniref:ABC transporter permease n=1 Tax=Herpetosiphon llansteffanensis TaxID=2094568 RepID=UPI000D7C1E88|nr:ABC transporter permease [Herpetosiphon llansteffanensis]